ncbi:lipoate--protein ligase [Spirochaetia bacterium]|nr:lipoate--protein ligase [Spirochaetia bacterium]GHV24833.1 lipoate--protein ligase [Spirochaetia bacterium]
MNYYIESSDTDPRRNLALEQFVFDSLDRGHHYFMLWQNHNAVIVGKHQNTRSEINAAFVNERNISVVRRLSGGGAVYHDLGNLNFTFITDAEKTGGVDFAAFCEPVQKALRSLGVPVEIAGRNDMTVEGKKFSGNAQYLKQGRIMHHGTILYDSDLSVLSQALNVTEDKIESKGIKSVRSRVTNIRPYMQSDMPIGGFRAALKQYMFEAFHLKEYRLSPEENSAVEELREQVYAQWNWNYGTSPAYNVRKTRRIEGCGKFEILMDVEKEGIIKNITFYGDFFGSGDPAELAAMLAGHHLEYTELKNALQEIEVSRCFHNLGAEEFLSLLLE